MVWHEQLVLHRAGVIEGYRVADGTRAWSMAENTSGASTPVASDDVVYVSSWNNLGEGDQRPALPDFTARCWKKYDKDGDGAISQAEFPDDLKFTARPGLETIPNSQNYVAFRTVDRNRNGVIDELEWEAFRNRVGTMATDHGLLAIRAGQVSMAGKQFNSRGAFAPALQGSAVFGAERRGSHLSGCFGRGRLFIGLGLGLRGLIFRHRLRRRGGCILLRRREWLR